MGLAASQARFLAVTARKADCEFRSMEIAQNKLSITRQLAEASSDYQNALNTTKLVWDYDCDEGDKCENSVNLSYGTLMTPSILNNFQPYLVTNRAGQIVLNSKYAAAAEAAGIPEGTSVSRSKDGFYKFVDALADQGLVSETISEKIQASKFYVYQGKKSETGGNSYVYDHLLDSSNSKDAKEIKDNKLITEDKYQKAYCVDNTTINADNGYTIKAVGNDIKAISKSGEEQIISNLVDNDNNQITANDSKLYCQDKEITIDGDWHIKDSDGNYKINKENGYIVGYDANAGFGSTPLSKNEFVATNKYGLSKRLDDNLYSNIIKISSDSISEAVTEGNKYKIAVNGNYKDSKELSSYTLGDILNNNVVIAYTFDDNGKNNKKPDASDVASRSEFTTYQTTIKTIISSMVDSLSALMPEYGACLTKYALNAIYNTFASSSVHSEEVEKHDTAGALTRAVSGASEFNSTFIATTDGKKDNCSVAVSLSNILKCLLTYADFYTNGDSDKYQIMEEVAESVYVTDDTTYIYPIKSEDSVGDKALLQTDFYMQLYNNICVHGWTTAPKDMEEGNNFEQLFKNGTYFISCLADDGYFYQNRYNSVDCIVEVKDEDAIAEAEAEFAAIQAKLTYKEDKLDLDMKNIDTEISALTTEIDSVKNLISKSVEKTFAMFQ